MRATLAVLLLGVGCTGTKTTPATFAKGTSTGSPTSSTVGMSGGALTSADGLFTLTVPAGALMADTVLTIEPITNTVPLGIGSAYRLGPEGTHFANPAMVTLTYAASATEGASSSALSVGYQDSTGAWRAYGDATVDDTASTVTVKTSHLSDWSLLLGWQIDPGSATVQANGSVALKLRFCEPEAFDTPEGELTGLLDKCETDDDLPHLVNVTGWSVNGQSGGSAQNGVVDGSGKSAMYTAPGSAPPNNPVAVSVQFSGSHKGGTQLAIANVTVGSGGWHGTVGWTLTGTAMTTDSMYVKTYTGTGNGTATLTAGAQDGLFTYASASSTYHYVYDEQYTDNYGAAGCMHMVSQTRHTTLDGTAMDATNLTAFLLDDGTGSGLQLSVQIPQGMTTGHTTTVGSDAVTGAGCAPVAPTNIDDPDTGVLPSDVLMFTIISTNPTMLEGTGTMHFEGMPPRDYTVTYSLQR